MKKVLLSIMQVVKRRCERKLAGNRQEKKKNNIKIKQAAPVLFLFFFFKQKRKSLFHNLNLHCSRLHALLLKTHTHFEGGGDPAVTPEPRQLKKKKEEEKKKSGL